MEETKNNFCERCGREINHKGRCLPCNYLYKHKKYFPGLKENPNYDIKHGIDTNMVKDLIEKGGNTEKSESEIKKEKKKEYKYKKTCIFCNFSQFGGIKNYNEFLQAFDFTDNTETKEKCIQFVDNVKRFLEIKGDWKIDKILENPREFLDRVKK